MLRKKCSNCKKIRLLTKFNKNVIHKDGLSYNCKSCAVEFSKNWNNSHKEYRKVYLSKYRNKNKIKTKKQDRKYKLKQIYGITENDYKILLKKQKNKCFICYKRHSKTKILNVDHCHKTNTVRGLLCSNCNLALGLLKENKLYIKRLLKYLGK